MTKQPPGDPYRKMQEGDSLDGISATAWNSFLDAGADFRSRRGNQYTPGDQQRLECGIFLVKNSSGADAARFDPIGLTSPLWDPGEEDELESFKQAVVFEGHTPNDDAWGIYLEPVPDGKTGPALVSGVVQCQVDITDESHEFCTASGGSLVSAAAGCGFILWRQNGTGTKWALVRISNFPEAENDSSSGTDTATDSACAAIPGLDLSTIPISTTPDYVLAIEGNCLVRVAVSDCGSGSS